jgi:glyoxylase-like metal-dependent hydrolase (beta-lactamase superfamily II)
MSQQILNVAPHVYCIYTRSYLNCTYLIQTADGVILIDTGMQSDASDTKMAFKKLGIPLHALKAILLTHWHNDHSAGTSELKELTGCITYCHRNEAHYFERKQSSKIRRLADYIPEYGILVLFKGLLGDTVPRQVVIDKLVEDGEIILDRFEVILTPGHTEGHISFYDRQTKILFAGDSLAVVKQKLRLMSKYVTPDKEASKTSIIRSLTGREIEGICPGHREPLLHHIQEEIAEFILYINDLKHWPALG